MAEYRDKPALDVARYKALGNSMAAPVMRWLGQCIATLDAVFRNGIDIPRVP